MQLQSKNINKVRLVDSLLYSISEIILQVVFIIWFCIGREIIFWLGSIQFNWESTYIRLQYHPIINVSSKLVWYHVQICSILVQVGVQKIQKLFICIISVHVVIQNIFKLCALYGTWNCSNNTPNSLTVIFYIGHYFL